MEDKNCPVSYLICSIKGAANCCRGNIKLRPGVDRITLSHLNTKTIPASSHFNQLFLTFLRRITYSLVSLLFYEYAKPIFSDIHRR
jgi:hypothetical protein